MNLIIILLQVQCSEVRCGAVRYGTVRYGTVRYGTVRYGTVRYGTVQYSTVLQLSGSFKTHIVQSEVVHSVGVTGSIWLSCLYGYFKKYSSMSMSMITLECNHDYFHDYFNEYILFLP